MNVLIIEDSDYKIEHLKDLVSEVLPSAKVRIARAFRSGVALATEERPGIVLLDMSLPTFEVSNHESGGRTRPFGGREVLREMDAAGVVAKVIIVTQFDRIGEGKRFVLREQLMDELRQEFPAMEIDDVYYNGVDSRWRETLKKILVGIDK